MSNVAQDVDSGAADDRATTPTRPDRGASRRTRLAAALLGILGTVLSLSVPFLPVVHEITTLRWPTDHGTRAVSAPLVRYSPIELNATVGCATARSLDARTREPGVLLSTNPPSSKYGDLTGMILQVSGGRLALLSRGHQLGTAPLPPGDCRISVHSDATSTTADVAGEQLAEVRGEDRRPQLTGIYSDLDESRDPTAGLSFSARVDNRWATRATVLKFVVIGLAVACFVGCVLALRRIDNLARRGIGVGRERSGGATGGGDASAPEGSGGAPNAGRRRPKLVRRGSWKPTLPDAAVFVALVVWWLVGAMTADDGYFLTMSRVRDEIGYVSDFYRWFAVPVAPMGWFVELYSLWVKVSTATPWVRLPALLMGIGSWLLISREVLPRLGQQVRRSRAAGWAAAAVFLAFWLPYNNGLRPEPVVVVFSLLALCSVERAVATRRLMPAAVGLVCAALSLAANPHGIVAVLPFVAALKPLTRVVRARAREFGWVTVLAPIAASGFVILTLAFWDQTLQAVLEATELRAEIGPSQSWYQELGRYALLFSQSADGSLTRRFPVLLVILCLVTCAVVLLRRGRIRGAALGPSRRLLAVAALSFVALALTPTKHTHHFGIFAAVGGALAALTALAASSTVLRSRRNRSAFFAGLMLIAAFSATGPNAWWYVSGWGVPWFDKPPSYQGYEVSTVLLLVAAVAVVVAFVEHLRLDEHRPPVDVRDRESYGRALRLGTAPLSVICALLVLGEVAMFGKAVQEQWGSYSLGGDSIRQLAGRSEGLSDYIYVEQNPMAGLLRTSERQPTDPAPGTDVPDSDADSESPEQYLGSAERGFRRGGLPPGDGSEPFEPDWQPPYGYGTPTAPVWGSYDKDKTSTGQLRTPWYELPGRARHGRVPVVLSLAGVEAGANSLHVEFGKRTERGFELLERRPVLKGPAPGWRDAMVTVEGKAAGAEMIRIVAEDRALGSEGWLAVSAPRVPRLTTMTEFVGDSPAFVEWTAAFQHPSLRVPGVRHGIAEMPQYRVSAGASWRNIGQGWSAPDKGGPFGWLSVATSMRKLPTYMEGDIHRDWGTLYSVDPYAQDALPAEAAVHVHDETHWGMWTPGPISRTIQLPGDVPSSDDRNDLEGDDRGGNDDGGGRQTQR